MLSILSLVVAAGPQALADIPMRPTTFTVDDRLSTGRVENFVKLFVDGDQVASAIMPASSADGTATLAFENARTNYAVVKIGDTEIGHLGPLTAARLHDVKAGVYDVTMTYSNGYVWSGQIATEGLDEASLKPNLHKGGEKKAAGAEAADEGDEQTRKAAAAAPEHNTPGDAPTGKSGTAEPAKDATQTTAPPEHDTPGDAPTKKSGSAAPADETSGEGTTSKKSE